jgi:hypothetical protein
MCDKEAGFRGTMPDKETGAKETVMKRMALLGFLALAVCAMGVGGALAAGRGPKPQPCHGCTVYFPSDSSPLVDFEVAKNGKYLTNIDTREFVACANLGPAPPTWPTRAPISGPRFTVSEIVPAHSKNSVRMKGHFTKNGGVKGVIEVATQCLLPPNFNSGPVKHKTFSWSATSEPQGKASAYCEPRSRQIPSKGVFEFSNIIVIRTTCPVVYKAINAGTFITTGTTGVNEDIFGEFSTPGWTCTRNVTTDTYVCKKPGKSFSFING